MASPYCSDPATRSLFVAPSLSLQKEKERKGIEQLYRRTILGTRGRNASQPRTRPPSTCRASAPSSRPEVRRNGDRLQTLWVFQPIFSSVRSSVMHCSCISFLIAHLDFQFAAMVPRRQRHVCQPRFRQSSMCSCIITQTGPQARKNGRISTC